MPGGPNFFGNYHGPGFLVLAKTREWGGRFLKFGIRYPEKPMMIIEHNINSPRKFVKLSLAAIFAAD
jgi:hypothetical protein